MANPAKKPTGFDLGKLEKMTPPFTIRVGRRDPKTQQYEPIALPQDSWSMEDAKRIEQILLNDVSGGGSYQAQISDTQGSSMQWDFVYPTDFFPSKIPPMAAGAATQQPPAGITPRLVASATQIPAGGWMPGMYGQPMAVPAAQAVPAYQPGQVAAQQFTYPQAYPQQYTPPPWWAYQAPPPSPRAGNGSGGGSPEVDMLRQQLEAVRQQAAEERHLRERQLAESQHQQELAEMRTQMGAVAANQAQQLRELRESLERRPRGDDDPTIQALKLQMEEQRRINEQMQRDRDRLEAESRHREELRQIQESSQRQIEALKDLIAEGNRNKIDPTMQMFVEIQRQQADAQRETSRLSAEQAREASRLASEQPRMVMDMMKQAKDASGADQVLSQLARAYEGVMNVQNKVMETMANMQGSPGWEMAGNALEAGRQTLEKFISSKRDQELAKSRTEQYRMQTEAYARAQAAAGATTGQQDPYRYEDGSIKGQSPERTQLGGPAPITDAEVVDPNTPAEAPANANGKGPKEAEIFGPIYDQVVEMRRMVAAEEVDADDVGSAVVQAAVQIQEQKVVIPVFALYADKRYGDLMEYVLPEASREFLGECVKSIERLRSEIEVNLA